MNHETFDTLTRSWGKSLSRRGALRSFAAALGIGLTATRFLDSTNAKKKGKKNKLT